MFRLPKAPCSSFHSFSRHLGMPLVSHQIQLPRRPRRSTLVALSPASKAKKNKVLNQHDMPGARAALEARLRAAQAAGGHLALSQGLQGELKSWERALIWAQLSGIAPDLSKTSTRSIVYYSLYIYNIYVIQYSSFAAWNMYKKQTRWQGIYFHPAPCQYLVKTFQSAYFLNLCLFVLSQKARTSARTFFFRGADLRVQHECCGGVEATNVVAFCLRRCWEGKQMVGWRESRSWMGIPWMEGEKHMLSTPTMFAGRFLVY